MSVFSPLALTQPLPFLPLAQGDIDYEVARRGEPDLFAKVLAEPATKVILVKDGKVAVPHGQGAIADYANVKMRLAQLPGAYVAAELESHPSALAIFLGSYGGRLGARRRRGRDARPAERYDDYGCDGSQRGSG